VCQVDLLPTLGALNGLVIMTRDVLNFPGKLLGITGLEEEQRPWAEVVLDAGRSWSNHRFAQGQILKNPGRRVNFRKRAAMIGNYSSITVFDFRNQAFKALRPQIMDTIVQALLASVAHHSL